MTQATVLKVERIRCMDEDDRQCECTHRVTARWCEGFKVIQCPSCGRKFELNATGEEKRTGLTSFLTLAKWKV